MGAVGGAVRLGAKEEYVLLDTPTGSPTPTATQVKDARPGSRPAGVDRELL